MVSLPDAPAASVPYESWLRLNRVRLADGAQVLLRSAWPAADVPRLRAMFYTLSDTTRYLYFCAGVPNNDRFAERVANLCRADGHDSYALVAVAGDELVGVARFNREGPNRRAEIGILLADAWQSRGLGREVLARLRSVATLHGVSGFTATVLGENRRAMRLLRGGFPNMRATWSSGQYEVDMPFGDEPMPLREA